MSYIQSQLMPGERVAHQARLHKLLFAAPALLGALALPGLIVVATHGGAGIGILVVWEGACLLWLLWRILLYQTSEFAVTDRRVILKTGVLSRRSVEMPIGKVESISLDQGLFGRMLGFGTLKVAGSGGTPQVFRYVAAPEALLKAIHVQVAAPAPALVAPTPQGTGPTKKCPFCAETIQAEAIKCRHCGERIAPN